MTLALFDLDNTLLQGDSDYEWGQFLVRQGLVDAEYYARENQRFYDEYKRGVLDIHEFSAFSFKPLSERSMEELASLHQQFMTESILPLITQSARDLIQYHKAQQHTLIIITATNSFVTRPIADYLEVPYLLATEPVIEDSRYTQKIAGIPCFQQGKVARLNEWLIEYPTESLSGSYFYSDSHNDLPMLEIVDFPIVVNPDEKLAAIALARGWSEISLKDSTPTKEG